jgi:hypothetical protein
MCSFDVTDNGLYYCTDCYDTQICANCFELFQKSAWLYKKCDVSHRHVFVLGPPTGLRVKISHRVKVGGEVRGRAQWLDGIRKAWGLPARRVRSA